MRYDVQWCDEIPEDEYGDKVHDAARFHVRSFPSRSKAEEFARHILSTDVYGQVRMEQVVPTRPDFDRDDWNGWRDFRGRWWEAKREWTLDDEGWHEV